VANAPYTNWRNIAVGGGTLGPITIASDTIVVYLVDVADYTFSAAHTNLSQLTAGGRVANATLGTKTVGTLAPGVFDSADPTFTSVSGDQSEAMVLLKSTGVESTSPLMVYYDTFSSGMPVTPNGGNIAVTVSGTVGWVQV
jgi:hypothetical protein